MSIKQIALNSIIGFLVLWGVWQIGEWIFSPQTISFIASLIFMGYVVFICHRVGQTVIQFVFSHVPTLPFPRLSSLSSKIKFPKSKSVFEAQDDK